MAPSFSFKGYNMKKPTRLPLFTNAAARYRIFAPEGQSIENVCEKTYFEHVTRMLKPGFIVEVLAEDGTWYAELMVRAVSAREAQVGVLSHTVFDGTAEPSEVDTGYEVKWRGPKGKFTVMRTSDGETVKAGFDSKEAASVWLAGHTKALAA